MNDELLKALGARFERADRRLFLVGGSVRDMSLGRKAKDWDFTTDALPEEIEGILAHDDWADALWDVGREFGTIAARKDGVDIEITTFRFDGPGRKPEVTFTDSLSEDLQRRDFTINAMAMHVDHLGLHSHAVDIEDPFGGRAAIGMKILDTPMSPERSFGDDPLRMLRAARFVSQLGFDVSTRVRWAMHGLRERIRDISVERITAEMDKLLMGAHPERGLKLLNDSGLLAIILPEVRVLPQVLVDGDVEARWADLLFAVDTQKLEKIVKRLRMSNERGRAIVDTVAIGQRFAGTDWDAPAIRKVLAQSGDNFLHVVKVLRSSDELLPKAVALLDTEGHPEPFMTGKEVMEFFGWKPGPRVGEAVRFLWELRLEKGPIPRVQAEEHLANWVQESA